MFCVPVQETISTESADLVLEVSCSAMITAVITVVRIVAICILVKDARLLIFSSILMQVIVDIVSILCDFLNVQALNYHILNLSIMFGYGAHGGQGRCYQFWQDFMQCVQANQSDKTVCVPFREDYDECLHGRKETARTRRIREEMERQEKAGTLPPRVKELLNEQ
eukprot:gene5403-7140_t